MSERPKSILIMDPTRLQTVYGPKQMAEIKQCTDLVTPPCSAEDVLKRPQLLNDVEIVFGSWGMPQMNTQLLNHGPKIKAIFYGAGSVKKFITEDVYKRGILVTNAQEANAVPVAEFCISTILFSLKLGWRHMRQVRENKLWSRENTFTGAFDSTVGLVSLGSIGLKTLELLRPFKLNILVYSTSFTPDKATELGIEVVGLDEIFKRSDVISLHTPSLPSTHHMITGNHFRMMPKNATFLNTARGAVVHQSEMIKALRERPDLSAVLDVVDPEPPEAGDEIFDVPNIFITPHLAGSLGNERRRLGQTAIDECKRFLAEEDVLYPVLESELARMA